MVAGIEMKPRDDGDSFSRYYDLDAWWEDRLTKLPDEIKRTFPFLAVPKPSKSEKNMGLDNFDKQQKIKGRTRRTGKEREVRFGPDPFGFDLNQKTCVVQP